MQQSDGGLCDGRTVAVGGMWTLLRLCSRNATSTLHQLTRLSHSSQSAAKTRIVRIKLESQLVKACLSTCIRYEGGLSCIRGRSSRTMKCALSVWMTAQSCKADMSWAIQFCAITRWRDGFRHGIVWSLGRSFKDTLHLCMAIDAVHAPFLGGELVGKILSSSACGPINMRRSRDHGSLHPEELRDFNERRAFGLRETVAHESAAFVRRAMGRYYSSNPSSASLRRCRQLCSLADAFVFKLQLRLLLPQRLKIGSGITVCAVVRS